MNAKRCKVIRRAVRNAFAHKPFEPVIKAYKEVVTGFNLDGTERKEMMACVTMVYPKDSYRWVYKNIKRMNRKNSELSRD